MIKLLLEAGANPDHGSLPHPTEDLYRKKLDLRALPTQHYHSFGLTLDPLEEAALLNLTDVVEELLRHGANPNTKRPLDISEEHLRILWERMKEPDFGLDKDNGNFVRRAINLECLDIIKWIIAQPGVVMSAEHLTTALDHGSIAIFEAVLSSPRATVNGKYIGLTPLTRASQKGKVELVKILLAHPDVDIDLMDDHKRTAAQWAESVGEVGILELINQERERRQVESTSEPTRT
ncbi:ankyrin [Lasiodiplodia theobromae]|uniref:Ankyrin n=1 Tax=Lasiodiplodia theobromae TaxID=45133 RepID=A0A8H7IQV9_9PEZI|nr:ankyrin [Lasiodiplodia theobromae]